VDYMIVCGGITFLESKQFRNHAILCVLCLIYRLHIVAAILHCRARDCFRNTLTGLMPKAPGVNRGFAVIGWTLVRQV
jgi:hypothetical protein